MEIITLGNDILRQKALPITDINGDVAALAESMLEIMRAGRGIGLAGPQIARQERIFVTQLEGDKPRVFINPSIIETSQEQTKIEEGCLSVPGVYSDVTRSIALKVQAWNERGRPFMIDADGFLARVILHEYDHLEGVLFIDRLPPLKRDRLIAQYEKRLRM